MKQMDIWVFSFAEKGTKIVGCEQNCWSYRENVTKKFCSPQSCWFILNLNLTTSAPVLTVLSTQNEPKHKSFNLFTAFFPEHNQQPPLNERDSIM